MTAVEIKKDIHWVGVIDWNLRDFHGYKTEKGSSYNAFLIKAGKNVLIDTVKGTFTEEFMERLKEIIEPEKIDYIICNHAEMDHSGALPELINLVCPEKLICSKACQDILRQHFHDTDDWPFEIVSEGQTIDIGGRSLQFFGSAMIHWPESMVTYLPDDRILFSNDIFGQHFATDPRFADEVDQPELDFQTAKYFANIFYPLSGAIRKFIDRLERYGVTPTMIAPDHGLIWRRDIDKVIDKYKFWVNGGYQKKAVILYDTMWESTAKMAEAVYDGLIDDHVSVGLFDLRKNHRSDIMTEILESRAVLAGCSILNGGLLPLMTAFMSYMSGLRPAGKIGASFGSYGWKNAITKILNERLEECRVELIDDGISVQYVPNDEDLQKCRILGEKIKAAILA